MEWSNIYYAILTALSYLGISFLLPLFVLHPIIKKEKLIQQLFICIICSNLYLFALGYILGFLKIFYWYTVFTGVVVIPLLIRIMLQIKSQRSAIGSNLQLIRSIVNKEYGIRLLWHRTVEYTKSKLKQLIKLCFSLKGIELLIVIACIVFSVYIYGYRKFRTFGYSAADEEVHLYWIQSLISNQIFPSGMYPYGMHSLLASISVLFGLNPVRITLGFSHIVLIMVLLTAYLTLKELYRSKFTVLIVFSFYTIGSYFSTYERFQYTLPMEYGMIALYILIFSFISYIQKPSKKDFILIAASIAFTMSCHFYVTIFAGILCVVMGICFTPLLWKRKIFFSLLGSGVLGIIVAALPFGVGYALNYPFEQSMSWAISIISPTTQRDDSANVNQEEDAEERRELKPITVENLKIALVSRIFQKQCYLLVVTAIVIFSLLYGVIGAIFMQKKEMYLLYIALSISWMIFALMAISYDMGWPVFIEVKRMVVFSLYFSMIIFIIPFDAFYHFIQHYLKKAADMVLLVISLSCITMLISSDHIRGSELQYWDIQSDGAMKLVLRLMEEKERFTWTVVSPVNDRSAILNYGFHYELLDFVEQLEYWNDNQAIYIPTPEVYFMIEKYPLSYILEYLQSPYPVTKRARVSKVQANVQIDERYEQRSRIYQKQRLPIMSKAYYWALEYQKYYPLEMSIYYEDEEVVIYRLMQDPYHLNNLSIQYK